mgnify:CR=1 FL=1
MLITEFTEELPTDWRTLAILRLHEVTLEMVSLPAGEFLMGSPDSDPDARDDEKPQHLVKVNSFAIGKYPVTQAQYQAVMETNPSCFENNPQHPVEWVSWEDAQAFCEKLSQITGKTYRLPTEAEWEYACRAGTTTRFYARSWRGIHSNDTTYPVGQKKPNAWGLYDMSGNVWEWCEDNWHDSYHNAPNDGSAWLTNENNSHILRGGSWHGDPTLPSWRPASRHGLRRDVVDGLVGFRVVCGAGRTL